MNRKLTLAACAVVLLTVTFIFFACKKNTDNLSRPDNNSSASVLKSWLQNQQQKVVTNNGINVNVGNKIINGALLWENAISHKTKDNNFTEIPVAAFDTTQKTFITAYSLIFQQSLKTGKITAKVKVSIIGTGNQTDFAEAAEFTDLEGKPEAFLVKKSLQALPVLTKIKQINSGKTTLGQNHETKKDACKNLVPIVEYNCYSQPSDDAGNYNVICGYFVTGFYETPCMGTDPLDGGDDGSGNGGIIDDGGFDYSGSGGGGSGGSNSPNSNVQYPIAPVTPTVSDVPNGNKQIKATVRGWIAAWLHITFEINPTTNTLVQGSVSTYVTGVFAGTWTQTTVSNMVPYANSISFSIDATQNVPGFPVLAGTVYFDYYYQNNTLYGRWK